MNIHILTEELHMEFLWNVRIETCTLSKRIDHPGSLFKELDLYPLKIGEINLHLVGKSMYNSRLCQQTTVMNKQMYTSSGEINGCSIENFMTSVRIWIILYQMSYKASSTNNPEQHPRIQNTFIKVVSPLLSVINDSGDMPTLDLQIIMDTGVRAHRSLSQWTAVNNSFTRSSCFSLCFCLRGHGPSIVKDNHPNGYHQAHVLVHCGH